MTCSIATAKQFSVRGSLEATGERVGVAAADLSTGEFRLIVTARADTDAVMSRLTPREMLVARRVMILRKARSPYRGGEGRSSPNEKRWEFDSALASTEISRANSASLRSKALE